MDRAICKHRLCAPDFLRVAFGLALRRAEFEGYSENELVRVKITGNQVEICMCSWRIYRYHIDHSVVTGCTFCFECVGCEVDRDYRGSNG